MRDVVVTLIRKFEPVSLRPGSRDSLSAVAIGKAQGWHQLKLLRRVLILADPGAGKTFEAVNRARKMHEGGAKAFFIRIEAIKDGFDQQFEVGTTAEFTAWLGSTEEAWFFLDSVDEAQLETPRALETAIQLFGERIREARERAHVVITSREDAWQAVADSKLVEQHLPFGAPPEKDRGERDDRLEEKRPPLLTVFKMAGLKTDEIKLFATHYDVSDVNAFVDAINRGGLMSLAERPFDLKALINKWQADFTLGSRLDVLRRMIELHLAPLSANAVTPRVEPKRARTGVQALAAAVTLTSRNVIALPYSAANPARVVAAEILPDWSADELNALLRTWLFDDIVYESVRFRHREIRELLAAEWANDLLGRPAARPEVEALFLKTIYGEEVVVPRMRPTLCWLIALDEGCPSSDNLRQRGRLPNGGFCSSGVGV